MTIYDTTPTPPVDYDQSKVPEPIKRRADYVRTKYKGGDILEATAQNAEVAGIYAGEAKQLAERTQIRQDAVEDFNNQVIQEMTDKDVISAPEIIAARGGKPTLQARLDETTAQLAQKASQSGLDITNQKIVETTTKLDNKRDKTTKITNVDLDVSSDGSKIKLINLSDEVKTAMAGTTPITATVGKRSVDNTRYADKSITRNKTRFFKNVSSNLFSKDEADLSGYYQYTTGNFIPSTAYVSSAFIEAEPNSTYIISAPGHVVYWDVEGEYISGVDSTTSLTTPANAATLTVSLSVSMIDTFIIAKGNQLPPYEKSKYKDENLYITNENIDEYSGISLSWRNLDFVEINSTVNLFDKHKRLKGVFGTTGIFNQNHTYHTSDYIPVEINKQYITNIYGNISYWDVNKNFISSDSGSNNYWVPNDPIIKYATFTVLASDVDNTMIIQGNKLPSEYISPYHYSIPTNSIKNELTGLKWAALGDSITSTNYADTPYWSLIGNKNGMITYNHGISGSRITITDETGAMSVRYADMEDDADIITVFGGVNDNFGGVPIGDITSVNQWTFYGALNVLCDGLLNKYPGKRIGFITPMQYRDMNRELFEPYVQAVKEVCAKYSIPVLDMYTTGGLHPVIDNINTQFFVDGLHPNNEGQKVMARRIESFIKSL